MSKNKRTRNKLIMLFGNKCMIEELGIRNIPVEKRRKIKGYKKSQETLTYHHIKEVNEGGQTTLYNGAIIRGYNHEWLHTLPEEERQNINQQIQQYKMNIISMQGDGSILDSQTIELDFDMTDCIEIPLLDNTEKDIRKLNKFNRAKQKKDTQKMINEFLYDEEEYER